MAVIVQELIIQSKIVDNAGNDNSAELKKLMKEVQLLKLQIKELKEKVENRKNEDER